MKKLKLVIFDLDGTLFRTETVDVEAFNRALEANGYKRRAEREILDLIGLTMRPMSEQLLGTKDRHLVDKFISDAVEFEREGIKKSGQLYEGVLDFLGRLKKRNYILSICSNGNFDYVMGIVEKFNLHKFFDEIWYDKGIPKAQAVGIIKERFNASRFVMAGDRACDIEACRENGGISIGVSYGYGKDEIKQADYIAKSIEEMEDIILKVLGD